MKIQIVPIKIGDMNTNEITIENSQKIKISFLSYCGIITKFEIPDVNGDFKNVVLCPKDNIEYNNSIKYGNIITSIDDKALNMDMIKCAFRGEDGFLKNNFFEYEYETFRNKENIRVILKAELEYKLGYKIKSCIEYSLDEENNFTVIYKSESKEDTYFNVFNNISLNLMKQDDDVKFNHSILMPSNYYYQASLDNTKVRRFSTKDTIFDFSVLKTLRDGIDSNYGMANIEDVYNTLFELIYDDIEPTISLYDDKSKRLINITTNNSHLFLNSGRTSKDLNFVNIRFYNLIYDKDSEILKFPLINSYETYNKFVNFNFKIM